MYHSRFDDIRPYHEHEINPAMQRIAASPHFPVLCSYIFPGEDTATIARRLSAVDSTRGFQLWVMRHFNEQVISRSTDGFTFSGLDELDQEGRYLFVSNHRDIVLDSALLQYALYLKGHETTDITFGANLMMDQLAVDIGRANKMFRVDRTTGARDFLEKSRHLSDFIREDIVAERRSVWIAQRNGRTKDGVDATDPGIVKMFCLAGQGSPAERLDQLHVVPVSVSYEWEPCDLLKAVELHARSQGPYTKRPGEDLNSILTGILQPKGRVHFSVGSEIRFTEEPSLAGLSKNEFFRAAAQIIDSHIHAGYHLWPSNFVACDILYGMDWRQGCGYTAEYRRAFETRMERMLDSVPEDSRADVRGIFLRIYSAAIPSDERP